MIRSIFFKEFLKIRWPWLTLVILNGLLMIYIFVATRHLFIMDHAEIVWYRVIHLGQIYFRHLKYAPLITGVLIACIQYLPEMIGERLRLTLHLPVPLHRLIMAHILVGLTALGVVVILDMALLALMTVRFFPVEQAWAALLTALPWCLAGGTAYLGVSLGLLEPGFKTKIFNLALAAGVANLFLYPVEPGGYRPVLAYLTLVMVLMIPAVLLPAYRFRYRRAG